MSGLAQRVNEQLALPLILRYHHFRNEPALRTLLAGRRVLVLGTGPSAAELGAVPDDVVIATCKLGLRLVAERLPGRRVDLYTCFRSSLETYADLVDVFQRTRPRIFMFSDLRYIRRRRDLDGTYSTLLRETGSDNYILRRLIAPLKVGDIRGSAYRAKTSSGIKLLQFALYYGAAEVHVLGIDFGRRGYYSGETDVGKRWHHDDIDENFVRLMSERHDNLYSASGSSPVCEYLGRKGLAS